MMGSPAVSVVVPTRDRLSLLQATVGSVLDQTLADLEVLVVDDGSADGSRDWLAQAALRDPRLHWLDRPVLRPGPGGAQVCRNLGLHQACGRALLFLDSDDLLAPSCLEQRWQLLQADPGLDGVGAVACRFRDRPFDLGADNLWGADTLTLDPLDCFLAERVPWQTAGVLWRREAFGRIGDWDEALARGRQDYELFVRALCRGCRIARTAEVDYHWRVPRDDCFSSAQAFQHRYGDGSHNRVLERVASEVIASGRLDGRRRRLLAHAVLRGALLCRHFGGSFRLAAAGVISAGRRGLLRLPTAGLAMLLLLTWGGVAGRNPAMAALARLAGQAPAPRPTGDDPVPAWLSR
jgi:glycosyltransferase involved in cell wall biosynthesis